MAYIGALEFSHLYNYPLWLIALLLILLLLVAEEIGQRLGLRRRARRDSAHADTGGGSTVLSSLLALLGLLMAFTYSAAVERYEDRRQAVIDEANALGTAFLRADVIVEPERTELKHALYEYALSRAPTMKTMSVEDREQVVAQSLEAQRRIWPLTRQVVGDGARGPVEAGLLSAITELLDMNTIRLAAVVNKLPAPAIYLLAVIAAVALAVAGYHAGSDGRISRWRMTVFALVLAAMMVLILDFDRPRAGFIRLDHLSIVAVIEDMKADLSP